MERERERERDPIYLRLPHLGCPLSPCSLLLPLHCFHFFSFLVFSRAGLIKDPNSAGAEQCIPIATLTTSTSATCASTRKQKGFMANIHKRLRTRLSEAQLCEKEGGKWLQMFVVV